MSDNYITFGVSFVNRFLTENLDEALRFLAENPDQEECRIYGHITPEKLEALLAAGLNTLYLLTAQVVSLPHFTRTMSKLFLKVENLSLDSLGAGLVQGFGPQTLDLKGTLEPSQLESLFPMSEPEILWPNLVEIRIRDFDNWSFASGLARALKGSQIEKLFIGETRLAYMPEGPPFSEGHVAKILRAILERPNPHFEELSLQLISLDHQDFEALKEFCAQATPSSLSFDAIESLDFYYWLIESLKPTTSLKNFKLGGASIDMTELYPSLMGNSLEVLDLSSSCVQRINVSGLIPLLKRCPLLRYLVVRNIMYTQAEPIYQTLEQMSEIVQIQIGLDCEVFDFDFVEMCSKYQAWGFRITSRNRHNKRMRENLQTRILRSIKEHMDELYIKT